MMKNTFYKFQTKNFWSYLKKRKYNHKLKEMNILKDYKTMYTLNEEDKVLKEMNQSIQDSKFLEALYYYDVNKNIIIKKKPEISALLKEAEEKYQNQLFDSVNPAFLSNNIHLKSRYIFWSKYFNLTVFLFLIYISFDWNSQFLNRMYKLILNKITTSLNELKNGKKQKENNDNDSTKSEENDEDDSPFSHLLNNNEEFKLAKNVPDRLSDVKGIDEVKEEIEEIVNMLKDPQKYEEAGAKLIRGVLLVGQPGTGKTLLARALAGESSINFIFLSASEFEQSLIGMGSIKLKKLFRFAKKNSPCIIFIDEIDSLLHKGKRSG